MSISLRAMRILPRRSVLDVRLLGHDNSAYPRRRREIITEDGMPAYWVARSKINDPVEYKKYTDLVPGVIAKYGGKVLARGGRHQIMEGPHKFHRFVVIEFPTF